ncbi:MAG: tRNA (adenosine(37)-N6)-dimethylallyltransferase MiaA [Pseudomonadota bacterium]
MGLIDQLPKIAADRPVLIAGPTASGKSALALAIARRDGGIIVNADASQVYACWRIVTARPNAEEEALAPHHLYGHVNWRERYSAGHWLREVVPLLARPERLIIVGGTGLYFRTLTVGMAEIPSIPAEIRTEADALPLDTMLGALDRGTRAGIDVRNRARVQRAWEVQRATGRSIAAWQASTPPPTLPLSDAVPLVMECDKDWLNDRIARRFENMIQDGALAEVAEMLPHYDARLPAFRAIGVPELTRHLRGEITLDAARDAASISTRQFAKRQRTWFRSKMRDWHAIRPDA